MSKTPSIPNSNSSGWNVNEETQTYVMRVNGRKYFVSKKEMSDHIQYIIGNNNLPKCVFVTVSSDYDEIILQEIRYSPICGQGGHQDKHDTVEMTLGVLHIVLNQHAELCTRLGYVKLRDTSRIERFLYPSKDGKVIGELILSDYYKLAYDKTWYETNFGAIADPTDGELHVTLKRYDEVLDKPKPSSHESFDAFWNMVVSERPTKHTLVLDSRASVAEAWIKKGSWRDFIKRMKHLYGGGAFFCLYRKLFLAYLQLPSLESTQWLIPFSEISSRNATIEVLFEQTGGASKSGALNKWKRKIDSCMLHQRPYYYSGVP